MNFGSQYEWDEEIEPNMTPMIDVVFLLIIFFLVAAQLSAGGDDEVQLASASEARPVERMDPDSIAIDIKSVPGGVVYSVSGEELPFGLLMARLRSHLSSTSDTDKNKTSGPPPVILRVDRRVQYDSVQKLMFECYSLGITVFSFQVIDDGEDG